MFEKYKNDFFRDITSFGGGYVEIVFMILFLLLNQIRVFKILLSGFILSYLISVIIRLIYYKDRPNKENHSNILERIDASSFPSVHSMRSVFIAITLSNLFNNYYVSVFLMLVALIVCYSRIYIKKHYWTDVIVGLILGIILALLLNRYI